MRSRTLVAAVAALALVSAGCGRSGAGEKNEGGAEGKAAAATEGGQPGAAPATSVRVARAVESQVRRVVPVTGSISALQTVDLAPKVAARVVSVDGREGARVRRGQVVVQQDTADLRTQVRQAEANLQSARARLSQTLTQERVQVISSATGVQDAQEQLRAAEAQLALAKRPQRTQEVAVAENAVRQAQAGLEQAVATGDAAVRQAQANYDRASEDRQRYERLVREGAAAQSVLDQYTTQEKVAAAALDSAKEQRNAGVKTARAQLDSARQQLSIARTGGRQESVLASQAAVARARAALRQAQANRQQVAVRQEDIRAARATIAQLEAALAFARQQLAYASIKSPIDGVIADRMTEPGQEAAPGQAVMRIVALGNVFFEAQVPETDIRSIRTGLSVPVRVDAYPTRVFTGRVARVYPTASTQSRNFVVRVNLPNSGGLLRPGMFARGEVVAESRRGVVVAKDALVSRNGKMHVFVVANGNRADLRPVRVGILTRETAEIREGVRAGEQIVIAGQDALADKAPVKVQGGEQAAAG